MYHRVIFASDKGIVDSSMLNTQMQNDPKAQLDEGFVGYGHSIDAQVLFRKTVQLSDSQTSSQQVQANINRFRKSYLSKRQESRNNSSNAEESKQGEGSNSGSLTFSAIMLTLDSTGTIRMFGLTKLKQKAGVNSLLRR